MGKVLESLMAVNLQVFYCEMELSCLPSVWLVYWDCLQKGQVLLVVIDAALKNWYCGDSCLNFEPTEMEHISLIESEWMLDIVFIWKIDFSMRFNTV